MFQKNKYDDKVNDEKKVLLLMIWQKDVCV